MNNNTKKCPNCNVGLPINNNFCTKCGYRFNDQNSSAKPVRKKVHPLIIVLAYTIVSFVLAILTFKRKMKSN